MNELVNRFGYTIYKWGPSYEIMYLSYDFTHTPVWLVCVDRYSLMRNLASTRYYSNNSNVNNAIQIHLPSGEVLLV